MATVVGPTVDNTCDGRRPMANFVLSINPYSMGQSCRGRYSGHEQEGWQCGYWAKLNVGPVYTDRSGRTYRLQLQQMFLLFRLIDFFHVDVISEFCVHFDKLYGYLLPMTAYCMDECKQNSLINPHINVLLCTNSVINWVRIRNLLLIYTRVASVSINKVVYCNSARRVTL